MEKKFLLKDILFNQAKIEQVSGEISHVHSPFKKGAFVRDVVSEFPSLELKARISWIAECLRRYLPDDYASAADILIRALPPPNDPELSDKDFGDFIYAPYSEFVAKNGCREEYLDLSLNALYEITQRFSAEDAIRYFINAFPDETMKKLASWAEDGHYHVRRLCSEGTRPKLPWSQKINIPATAPLPILEKLFSDKKRFVTRSVANHINDISKAYPELALETLAGWKRSGKQAPGEMDYILRHSLRTLIKQGNPKAMEMLGFKHAPDISISGLAIPRQVKMNTALDFSFTIESPEDIAVVIDYKVHFQNKAGKMGSMKVFKLKQIGLEKGKPIKISKSHMLLERMTTRTLYPGEHAIEIQVNGKSFAKASFLLIPSGWPGQS